MSPVFGIITPFLARKGDGGMFETSVVQLTPLSRGDLGAHGYGYVVRKLGAGAFSASRRYTHSAKPIAQPLPASVR